MMLQVIHIGDCKYRMTSASVKGLKYCNLGKMACTLQTTLRIPFLKENNGKFIEISYKFVLMGTINNEPQLV